MASERKIRKRSMELQNQLLEQELMQSMGNVPEMMRFMQDTDEFDATHDLAKNRLALDGQRVGYEGDRIRQGDEDLAFRRWAAEMGFGFEDQKMGLAGDELALRGKIHGDTMNNADQQREHQMRLGLLGGVVDMATGYNPDLMNPMIQAVDPWMGTNMNPFQMGPPPQQPGVDTSDMYRTDAVSPALREMMLQMMAQEEEKKNK